MAKSTPKTSVTVHQLPQDLLDKPLEDRFELALQHWLDLYPGSTSLRFGQDPESGIVCFTENMYGPRLEVMTRAEEFSKEARLDERATRSDPQRKEIIAQKLGVHLRPMMASDPSAELYYKKPSNHLQYAFRTQLVAALNHGLGQLGCRTHSVRLSDHNDEYMALHKKYWSESEYSSPEELDKMDKKMSSLRDPNATIVWQKKDAFSPETPGAAVYEALTAYFAGTPGQAVPTHVTLGDTIDVKKLDDRKWVPMEQTEVERIIMKAKQDLADPTHPWVAARVDKDGNPEDPQLYAYIASQYPNPPVRNGNLIYEGKRFDVASEKHVGYVVVGSESCGSSGIERDIEGMLRDASNGQFSQMRLNYVRLPDVLVSAAYHAQAVAHQKEQAAWAQKHPTDHAPGRGPVMTKAVADLQVGDHLGVSSQEDGTPDLWCKVTKREGDVVTLFIHNGHWDFKLDTSTNQSLDHDMISDFAGKARVVYTAPIPITNGALYSEALEYMRDHAAASAPAPSL